MAIVKTARGAALDMGALTAQNEDAIAVTGGGRQMNARGDLLGSGGKILKTREEFEEQMAEAYSEQNPNATKKVSIKNPNLTPDIQGTTPREQAQAIIEEKIAPKLEAEELTPDGGKGDVVEESVELEPVSLEDAAEMANPKRKKRNTSTDVS